MTWLIKREDGETILSLQAASLIFGAPVDEIACHEPLPDEWLKPGRRRSREAAAHTGDNDIVGVLRYWAQKELGLDVFDLGDQVILTEP